MARVFRIGDKVIVLGSTLGDTGHKTIVASTIAPSFSVNPSVSGNKQVGQVLTTTSGTFSGIPTPTVTSREWEYSVSGSGSPDGVIDGQTSTTYTVTTERVSQYVRSKTVITNSAGTATAYSSWYGPMQSASVPTFPDASTTGPRFALTNSGTINSSSNGQIIERRRVTGSIFITHSNVIVRDCEVISSGVGIEQNGGSNLTIEYCSVHSASGAGNKGSNGIALWSGSAVVQYCNIYGIENGMFFGGSDKQFLNNYIHDLLVSGADPHYDGIQSTGADTVSNILFQGNHIISHDTSCIIMQNESGGYTGTIRITGNKLIGNPSVAAIIYARGDKTAAKFAANLEVTNNVMSGNAYGYNLDNAQGPGSGTSGTGTLTWTGNVDLNGNVANP